MIKVLKALDSGLSSAQVKSLDADILKGCPFVVTDLPRALQQALIRCPGDIKEINVLANDLLTYIAVDGFKFVIMPAGSSAFLAVFYMLLTAAKIDVTCLFSRREREVEKIKHPDGETVERAVLKHVSWIPVNFGAARFLK